MTRTILYNGQQYLATKLLKEPHGYKKHEIDQAYSVLRRSIIDKGVKSPIILNENPERKNVIIHGVQVYRIAQELRIAELPVWYTECSIEEEHELRILLDKKATAELSPDEIFDLIGGISYEKFFGIEECASQIIENALFSAKVSNDKNSSLEPKVIKQVLLRLSPDQKNLFDDIMKRLDAKNQTEALIKLMNFYQVNHGGGHA